MVAYFIARTAITAAMPISKSAGTSDALPLALLDCTHRMSRSRQL